MQINQTQPMIGVGIMLVDSNNHVLLGSRNKIDEVQSLCFPGGKMDMHESIESAAMRELLEETALDLSADLENIYPMITIIDQKSDVLKITFGTIYRLKDENLKHQICVTEPHIFKSWEWFDIYNLPHSLFPETEVILRYYLEQKQEQHWGIYGLSK